MVTGGVGGPVHGGGLATTIDRQGLATRWIIHGSASHLRFSLDAADGKELRVFFEHCRLESVDFTDIDFNSFYAGGSVFKQCDFSRTKFLQLDFGQPQIQRSLSRPIRPTDPRYPQTVYEECVFGQTRFDPDNTYFGNARFVRCIFDRAWLRKLFTRTAEFIDCRFEGKVIECTFHGTITNREDVQRIGRSANEFRGNDFRKADLIWTEFRGIDLTTQILPESDSYAVLVDPLRCIDVATNQAQADLKGELRDKVVHQLALLAQLAGDERQILIRRGELGWEVPNDVQEPMWAYLTGTSTSHRAIQT